jgi:membrane dipeptidase
VVRSVAEYRSARARGAHGAFLGIQGGNALGSSPEDVDGLGRDVIRVTLVHLTSSRLGTTSSPLSRLGSRRGLSKLGEEVVRRLDAERVLVDLAHISEPGFWAAVAAHDPAIPLIVTHTGVDGVRPHWRNLTDEQVRAVAASGGCVGVMLQESFLGRPTSVATVVDHLAHIGAVGGWDAPAVGTDFDGMVTPPTDLCRYAMFPRLVAEMRRRGWDDTRIGAVLGGNALRTIEAVRG